MFIKINCAIIFSFLFIFIVDHKVRPESTEEAEWVAEQLRSKCKSIAYMLWMQFLIRQSTWNPPSSPSHGPKTSIPLTSDDSKPKRAPSDTRHSVEHAETWRSRLWCWHTMQTTRLRRSWCASRIIGYDRDFKACRALNGYRSVGASTVYTIVESVNCPNPVSGSPSL